MQGTRNKIVFCKEDVEGLDFINVGKELSILLGDNPQEISGFETMYRKVLNRSKHSDQIGTYLAVENIGILFEQELAQFKFSVASPRGANQKMVQHDTG